MLISPPKHPGVPHAGFNVLFISTSLFLMSSGNASSASTNKIWENENGISVYSWSKAWGKKQDETLTHNDIIIHLRKAFQCLERFN
jgi:hypothetical protein